MKSNKPILHFLLITIIFYGVSCSVQKRRYRSGFYISKTEKHQQQTSSVTTHNRATKADGPELIETHVITRQQVTLSSNAAGQLQPIKKHHHSLFKKPEPDSCDVIILRNGDEVRAKVTELTSTEVKYKKCGMTNGPLYVSKKSEIFIITYANGMRESFKQEPEIVSKSKSTNSNKENGKKKENENGVLALVLGIAGIFIGIGSIPAIILGSIALKEIRANPDKYNGGTLAKIGIALGVVKLILLILVLVLIFSLL